MDAAQADALIVKLRERGDGGVYVGRLNPMHVGHGALIDLLLRAYGGRHLILVGSCNHPISIRHLFRFSDRCEFVQAVFPEANVVPMPDFETDDEWFHALGRLVRLGGLEPATTVFLGGCDEDVNFYHGRGYRVEIVNRFDGTTKNVSGTEIRDCLIKERDLSGLLHPKIADLVRERFRLRWSEAVRR